MISKTNLLETDVYGFIEGRPLGRSKPLHAFVVILNKGEAKKFGLSLDHAHYRTVTG
jgi:hypothetical protein